MLSPPAGAEPSRCPPVDLGPDPTGGKRPFSAESGAPGLEEQLEAPRMFMAIGPCVRNTGNELKLLAISRSQLCFKLNKVQAKDKQHHSKWCCSMLDLHFPVLSLSPDLLNSPRDTRFTATSHVTTRPGRQPLAAGGCQRGRGGTKLGPAAALADGPGDDLRGLGCWATGGEAVVV